MSLFILSSMSSDTFRLCVKYYAYVSATKRATCPANLDFIALIINGGITIIKFLMIKPNTDEYTGAGSRE